MTNPAAAAPGVADHYLNPAGWIGRAAIAMLGWSLLAVLLLRGTRTQRLTAGLGLCFHAVIVTLIGIDWVLSVAPRFYSTAFGMGVATMQILSALAWVAALRIVPPGGAGKAGDIGGLIIAAALGSLYLGFSQYLVIWYGDIPQRVTWYLDRQSGIWPWIDIAAMALCGLLPFFVLMRQRWRNSPGGARRHRRLRAGGTAAAFRLVAGTGFRLADLALRAAGFRRHWCVVGGAGLWPAGPATGDGAWRMIPHEAGGNPRARGSGAGEDHHGRSRDRDLPGPFADRLVVLLRLDGADGAIPWGLPISATAIAERSGGRPAALPAGTGGGVAGLCLGRPVARHGARADRTGHADHPGPWRSSL